MVSIWLLCYVNQKQSSMIKKVGEIIKIIEADGWFCVGQEGSHKQYKHSVKKGRVTVPDHGKNKDLDHKTVKSILKQAGLK
jgi:predicted RNA binding protein YcfA (HicA-like mRNA interferase family)